MNIKWNWGTGIFIAIIAMMSFVGFMVYKSFDYKINKVSEDYYDKGLNHTQQMERVKNSRPLESGFEVIYTHDCEVKFPDYFKNKELNGEILFFRPSDYSNDRSFEIKLDTTLAQHFSLDNFLKGKYIVKATFDAEGVGYYFEKDIIFN
jgi:hypothetical protein